jgi:peptide/nickel transport system permease protein
LAGNQVIVVRSLLGRIAGSIVVLVGVSLLIFTLARIIPGDPARVALGPDASPLQVEDLRAQMGFNRPIYEQYALFMAGAVQFDFGRSLYTDRPVAADLADGFPATLELVLVAGTAIILLGGLLGVVGAHYRDRWPDNAARIFALLAIAMPKFVWAILLMLLLSFWLGWLPIAGRLTEGLAPPPYVTGLLTVDAILAGDWNVLGDALRHIALPAFALALSGVAQISRITRTNMIDSYARPYVEFARAYGVSERAIALRWALRPALIPTMTVLGMQIVAMLGNAFVIEAIFLWPGMAKYGVNAIIRKDLNAIVAVVLVISVFFVMVNIMIDAIVSVIDPRIRLRGR